MARGKFRGPEAHWQTESQIPVPPAGGPIPDLAGNRGGNPRFPIPPKSGNGESPIPDSTAIGKQGIPRFPIRPGPGIGVPIMMAARAGRGFPGLLGGCRRLSTAVLPRWAASCCHVATKDHASDHGPAVPVWPGAQAATVRPNPTLSRFKFGARPGPALRRNSEWRLGSFAGQ